MSEIGAAIPPAIAYTVRRSRRARHARVRVDAGRGVEVVLPVGARDEVAAAAIVELRPWIERRLADVQRTRERIARRDGGVPYLGETLSLRPEAGRTRAARRGAALLVPAHEPQARLALERWYRRAARREIATRLDSATAAAGLRYRDLAIRGQRTRWASCSATGRMSFNWRLLLAPPRVLDYVVWHEVCHLEIMDHSARFWALLERRWPDYRADRDWLREFGPTLTLD